MTTAQARRFRLAMATATFAAGVGCCFLLSGSSAPVYGAQEGKGQSFHKSSDPLFPKDANDVAIGYAACAACHAQTLPVNTKINPFAKDFKSHEFVLLSEGGTWLTQDPHSAAHRVLKKPLGEQMSRILKYDVTKAPQCLTCHAIDKYPGMPITKDTDALDRFGLSVDKDDKGKETVSSEGVTCNACHGVRKAWQGEHFANQNKTIPWRTHPPEEKEQKGMRNLRDPVVRAKLCASCHVGDPELNRVVTHEMYAAGHPPLPPFELGSFMQSQPQHWGYPISPELKFFTDEGFKAYAGEDFVKKHPNWTWELYRFFPQDKEVYLARQISAGAVASLHAEMKLIAADAEAVMKGDEGAVDFARFDCFACHHDLKFPSPRQERGYGGNPPGRPPLKAWTAALPSVVAAHAAGLKPLAGTSDSFAPRWDAVQGAAMAKPFGKPKELAESARQMAAWCEDFMKKGSEGTPLYTKEEATKLLAVIGEAATSKKWTADPEAAMHLTWAYLALREHMKMDVDKAALDKLGVSIPTRVRQPRKDEMGKDTYSDPTGDPITVGTTLRERLDVFGKYDPKQFIESFEAIHGKK